MDAVIERARRVRLLVLDVDGVLTDGRLFISSEGEEFKVFHVRDGSGIVAALRAGVTVAIISGRDSAAVTRRAGELGIRHVRQGIGDKGAALDALLGELPAGATIVDARPSEVFAAPEVSIRRAPPTAAADRTTSWASPQVIISSTSSLCGRP